jgi:hypothetical protein
MRMAGPGNPASKKILWRSSPISMCAAERSRVWWIKETLADHSGKCAESKSNGA